MTILFTGATGVIGSETLPKLIAAGHEVKAVARSEAERAWITAEGGKPLNVDLFDPSTIGAAMVGTDIVIHFATAIPPQSRMTKRDSWTVNDRIRDEGTRNLVDAALEHGVDRFIQQSVTFMYADGGDRWLDENAPIDPVWDVLDSAIAAEGHVARFAEEGGTGVILRLGRLYGPGRASGDYIDSVANRKMPVLGSGDNFVSSVHVEDVASAVVASVSVPAGTYNVVDDDPVTSSVLVESLADLLGAAGPRHLPKVVGRLGVGKAASLLTVSHRVSNSAFEAASNWEPSYPSVVDGWEKIVRGTSRRHDGSA